MLNNSLQTEVLFVSVIYNNNDGYAMRVFPAIDLDSVTYNPTNPLNYTRKIVII